MRRVRAIVSGTVQGVGFRFHTVNRAHALGCTGWVRNLADGRVEFEAQGSSAAIESLLDWARHGPSSAEVDDLRVEERPTEDGDGGFGVRR